MDLQRYPPIHDTYDYLSQARKDNIRVIEVPEAPGHMQHVSVYDVYFSDDRLFQIDHNSQRQYCT